MVTRAPEPADMAALCLDTYGWEVGWEVRTLCLDACGWEVGCIEFFLVCAFSPREVRGARGCGERMEEGEG